jgi:hypothetical protein
VGRSQGGEGLGLHHPPLQGHSPRREAGSRQALGLEHQGPLEGPRRDRGHEAGPVVVGPGVGVATQGLEGQIEALAGQALRAREQGVLEQVSRAGLALGIVGSPGGHQQLHAHHGGPGFGVQHHPQPVVQLEAAVLDAQGIAGRGRGEEKDQQRRHHQKRCPLKARYRARAPSTSRWNRARGMAATNTARQRRTSSPRRMATICSTVPA